MSIAGGPRWRRIVVVVLIYGGLLSAGHWGSGWLIDLVGIDLGDGVQSHEFHVMIVGIVFYAVLMALPFVPGMEISFALLAVFGPVTAPALSWLVGRLVPVSLVVRSFGALGLRRAKSLIDKLEPSGFGQRLEMLIEHAPKRIVLLLLKHRYIAVIVALNMPGNAVIGGGGIALLAGMSGLFTLPRFLAAVALAALPVPLAIMLTGG